jgi:TRAP-type C4-dicarboxylate transport system permease large subunit
MGGLFVGLFTPTEAGAVGAFTMLVISVVTKQLNMERFFEAIMESARLMAMVFSLFTFATIFGRFLAVSTIPTVIGRYVAGLPLPRVMIMAVVLLFFIVLGFFIYLVSMIILTMPIFYPIVVLQLVYDRFWFGSVLIMLICIGSLTPPFGGNIFILKGCTAWDESVTLVSLFKGVWPFCIAALICIVLLMLFPWIGSWLPHLVYG